MLNGKPLARGLDGIASAGRDSVRGSGVMSRDTDLHIEKKAARVVVMQRQKYDDGSAIFVRLSELEACRNAAMPRWRRLSLRMY